MKLRIRQILMLNLFLAVLLQGSAFAEPQDGCLKLKELWTEYNAVAKGTSMPVQLKFETHDCHLPLVPSASNVSLTATTQMGFDLKTYYRGYKSIKPGSSADGFELTVMVTMSEYLQPGKYEVPAVLSYDAVDKKGDLVQERTALVIPVKVVSSASQVEFKKHPDHLKPVKIAGMVGLGIALFPVLVALGIFQFFTGIQILSDC